MSEQDLSRPDPDASPSPGQWRGVRAAIDAHRPELAAVAARLYPSSSRVAATDLLCRDDWIPETPLDIDDLTLDWLAEPHAPAVDGTGPLAAAVLPPKVSGGRYCAYSAAIADLDRPALFENRACYRLLDVLPARLLLGPARYFEAVNTGGAIGHELAAAWLASTGQVTTADLPLRASVGDPCALRRRCAIPAVTTLTLRRGRRSEPTFFMHWRDPAKVNHAGGVYQVIPAGIFQPLGDSASAARHDLSLWRAMTREFGEELLGLPDSYPAPHGLLDYANWPLYQRLNEARETRALRVSWVGLGVDPLTLATDILTVAVFDDEVFDSGFAAMVAVNDEGTVLSENGSARLPFTAEAVDRFSGGHEPVQPAGAALLRLAWRHRRHLLG